MAQNKQLESVQYYKLKTKFPSLGSKTLVDRRGLGFTQSDTEADWKLAPSFLYRAATLILAVDVPFVSQDQFLSVLNVICDASRAGFLRGNAWPVAGETRPQLLDDIQATIKYGFQTPIDRYVFDILIGKLVAETGILDLAPGFKLGVIEEITNPVVPAFGRPGQASGFSTGVMAFGLTEAVDNMLAEYNACFKPKAHESYRLDVLAANLHTVWNNFARVVSEKRAVIAQGTVALARCIAAVQRGNWIPSNLTTAELSVPLSFANVFEGSALTTLMPGTRLPTAQEESAAKNLIAAIGYSFGDDSKLTLLQAVNTVPEFSPFFEQFDVRLSGESAISTLHVTKWRTPLMQDASVLSVQPMAKNGTNNYAINPDAAASSKITQMLSGINKATQIVRTQWTNTANHWTSTGGAYEHTLKTANPYHNFPAFSSAVLLAMAVALSRDVTIDANGIITYYRDQDYDRTIAPASSGERQLVPTTDAADIIAHAQLPQGTAMSAWKHPSISGLLGVKGGYANVPASARTWRDISRKYKVNPKTNEKQFDWDNTVKVDKLSLLTLNDTVIPVAFPLYTWFGFDNDHANDLYIDYNMANQAADIAARQELDALLTAPEGGGSDIYRLNAILAVYKAYVAIAAAAASVYAKTVQGSSDLTQCNWFDSVVTDAAKIVLQQNVLAIYSKLLTAAGFTLGAEIETLSLYVAQNFHVNQIVCI